MHFVADSWSISLTHSNNTRAQKLLAKTHLEHVLTQSTLRGEKHFNNAPTTTSFTHHHAGIRKWERNEGILTSNFEVTANR